MACAAIPGIDNFASTLIAYTDCQTALLATRGYGALTSAGGLVPTLLLALVTVFIALWGYQLLFGARPNSAEVLGVFARFAIVLTLASSWPAYQRLIYDVVLQTPAQVAGTIDMSGTGRDDGQGLAARLDDADARFVRLAIFGTGAPQTPEEAAFARANTPPPLFLNFDSFALGISRLTFLVSAVGSFALVRLLSGALLALGPVIVMFLLFNATRGLVVGWLRALVGLIAAGIISLLIVDIETMLLVPWLSDLLAKRAAEQPIYAAASQLLAATAIFAIVIFAGIRLSQRLMGVVWPSPSAPRVRAHERLPDAPRDIRAERQRLALPPADQQSRRAQAVAEAVAISDHRRTRLAGVGAVSSMVSPAPATSSGSGWTSGSAESGRRVRLRGSASSARRDRR